MSDERPFVLLVDDDPHTRAIFELLMEHHELPFMVASDSVAALDCLKENSPDIVVIDLFLPGLDGFQTLKQISSIVSRAHCRFLATTAYYTKDTQREVVERGFDGYIPKPFVPNNFIGYLYGTVE